MGKATFRYQGQDIYVNPNQVVRVIPAVDPDGALMMPERCVVVFIDGEEMEMDGDLDAVMQALKVP